MRTVPDPLLLAVLLADGMLLLLLYGRLLAAVRGSVDCLRSAYGTAEMLGNNYLCSSVQLISATLIPAYAATLYVTDVSTLSFGWTLLVFVSLMVFRKLVNMAMGWLSSQPAMFRSLHRVSQALAVAVTLASLVALLVGWLAPQLPRWILWIYLAVVALAGSLVYVWRGFSIILQTRFSSFFWVLYLCGLEFLPVCVAVNILIHGN